MEAFSNKTVELKKSKDVITVIPKSVRLMEYTDSPCGNWTFRSLTVSPQDVSPPAWTFRLLDVSPMDVSPLDDSPPDDSPHTSGRFAQNLRSWGFRPLETYPRDGRFAPLKACFRQFITAHINGPYI